MPSRFNVKGEVILRNALTFKVKPEVISENPFVIYINLALRKYQCITLFLTRLAKTSPESRCGEGRGGLYGNPGGGRMKKGQLGSYGTPLVILRHASTERDR